MRRLCPLLALLVFLFGCWDGREIERRALVLTISLDAAPGGVQLGVQIALPRLLGPAGPAGGSPQVTPAFVRHVVARDAATALSDLQMALDRDLFFGHVRVVLVGEELARQGVWPHLAALYGNTLVPRTAWVAVVEGQAESLLAVHPPLENIPPTYLTNFFENRVLFQRPYDLTLGGFHQRLINPGVEPVALWLAPPLAEGMEPRVLGLAAFQGDRFAGGMSLEETYGWLLAQNQQPIRWFTVDCPRSPGIFRARLTTTTVTMRPVLAGNRLERVAVSGWVKARVDGQTCVDDFADPLVRAAAQAALARHLIGLVERAAATAQQELRTDVFGFGLQTFRYGFRAWPGDAAWRERFPGVPVRVDLNVRLDVVRTYRAPVPGPPAR